MELTMEFRAEEVRGTGCGRGWGAALKSTQPTTVADGMSIIATYSLYHTFAQLRTSNLAVVIAPHCAARGC